MDIDVAYIQQINTTDLVVSSTVLLEIQMLYEKGKLKYGAKRILADLSQQIGVSV